MMADDMDTDDHGGSVDVRRRRYFAHYHFRSDTAPPRPLSAAGYLRVYGCAPMGAIRLPSRSQVARTAGGPGSGG